MLGKLSHRKKWFPPTKKYWCSWMCRDRRRLGRYRHSVETFLPVNGATRIIVIAAEMSAEEIDEYSASSWRLLQRHPCQIFLRWQVTGQQRECSVHLQHVLQHFIAQPGFWTALSAAMLRIFGIASTRQILSRTVLAEKSIVFFSRVVR